MPAGWLSGIAWCGTDSRRITPPGGTTTLLKLACRLITAWLAEIWSTVRKDELPSHHLLDGTLSSAKRCAAPA